MGAEGAVEGRARFCSGVNVGFQDVCTGREGLCVFGVPEVGHESRATGFLAVGAVADEAFQWRRGEGVGDGTAETGPRHIVKW